jgi:hypothetical protein
MMLSLLGVIFLLLPLASLSGRSCPPLRPSVSATNHLAGNAHLVLVRPRSAFHALSTPSHVLHTRFAKNFNVHVDVATASATTLRRGLRSTSTLQGHEGREAKIRKKLVGERDLTLYDDGGLFEVRYGLEVGTYFSPDSPTFKQSIKANADARQFIWDHWTQRRRAYLRVLFTDIDWSSMTHVFIEPDTKGNWSILWSEVLRGDKIRHTTPITGIKRVKLRVVENRWFFPGDEVPDDLNLASDEFALIFVNADGTQREPF